jgi:alanine dehydrogenase
VIIGIPREIKPEEKRVSLTPDGVEAFVRRGHTVFVEFRAGEGCGISDGDYKKAGASVKRKASTIWSHSDLIIKVKEPLSIETRLMREKQFIFTFLHLAANKKLTVELLKKKVIAIAYETIQEDNGCLPILKPMSEIAGHLSAQLGSRGLDVHNGGRGILMGGVRGANPARVTVIGGGSAGQRAAEVATGLGARVTILDIDTKRVKELRNRFGRKVKVERSTAEEIETKVLESDLVIGSVLNPGAKAPKLITKELVKKMKKGAVIVDIAVDQGGCCETIRPTTHAEPFYVRYGVVHCGITNLPSTVPLTSTSSLCGASLPYALQIADQGIGGAASGNQALYKGITVFDGKVTNRAVAEAHGLSFCKLSLGT